MNRTLKLGTYLIVGTVIICILLFVILTALGPYIGSQFERHQTGDCAWSASAESWLDENENAIWDANESPLQNIVFHVDDTHNSFTDVASNAVSNSRGRAEISVWLPGCPEVKFEVYAEAPAGYKHTSPDRIEVKDNETQFSFGFAIEDVSKIPVQEKAQVTCEFYGGFQQIRDIAVVSSEEVWVTTQTGAIQILPAENHKNSFSILREDGFSQEDFHAVVIAPDGTPWFATHGGAYYFDGTEIIGQKFSDDIRLNVLMDVVVDDSGSIWFGSHHQGVIHLDPSTGNWKNFKERDGLPSDSWQNMILAPDQSLWFINPYYISKLEDPIEWGENPKWHIFNDKRHPSPLSGWMWENNVIASDGSLWLSGDTDQGPALANFNPFGQTWKIYDYSTSGGVMYGGNITSIATANDNTVWVGTPGNGLMKLIPGDDHSSDSWLFFDTTSGLISNTIWHIEVNEEDGTLWLAHDNGVASCTVFE